MSVKKVVGTALERFDVAVSGVIMLLVTMAISTFNIFSANPRKPVRPGGLAHKTELAQAPDSIPISSPILTPSEVVEDELTVTPDSVEITPVDTFQVVAGPTMKAVTDSLKADAQRSGEKWTSPTIPRSFNPDPTRAVWLSALCPGLGQIYNRRYWKLPLVVAGYMGLIYGTSWNNMMLTDYTRAYSDLLDNDPSTKSYMDFFPPTVKEEDLNKQWLTNLLKSRKDYYRRNRDLCIIGMVGVYMLAMVDAYVDASLSHFDISPDLSIDVAPAILPDSRGQFPGIGLAWALNF